MSSPRELPCHRLWQPITDKWFLGVFGICQLYETGFAVIPLATVMTIMILQSTAATAILTA